MTLEDSVEIEASRAGTKETGQHRLVHAHEHTDDASCARGTA